MIIRFFFKIIRTRICYNVIIIESAKSEDSLPLEELCRKAWEQIKDLRKQNMFSVVIGFSHVKCHHEGKITDSLSLRQKEHRIHRDSMSDFFKKTALQKTYQKGSEEKMGGSTHTSKKINTTTYSPRFFDINNTARKIIPDSEEGTVFFRCATSLTDWQSYKNENDQVTTTKSCQIIHSFRQFRITEKKFLRDRRNDTSLRLSGLLEVWCPTSAEDAESKGSSSTQSSKRSFFFFRRTYRSLEQERSVQESNVHQRTSEGKLESWVCSNEERF